MNVPTYNLGLVSVSFRNHTPEEILQAMKNTDLQCIEWGSDIHAPCHDIPRLKYLASLQTEYNIRCCSYGTYFRLGETPIQELQAYIDAAKVLNTNILRLWCGSKSGKNMREAERDNLIYECRTAAEIARQNDVILCMECHRNTLTDDCRDGAALMEAVHSPHFRMYWQPFQWQSVEENVHNAKLIAPYTEHIHVFNWREDEMLPLHEAIEDWRRYLVSFGKPHTLLLEFMPKGTLVELPTEAESLKQIVGGLYESNLCL